ncbi:MAG: hypothetical protein JNM47_16555 [Hyphomonadaceae bacterium]|nr:hypothetical protein [Hyphomonadaceae bacterium]
MFGSRTLQHDAWRPAGALLATLGVASVCAPSLVGVAAFGAGVACLMLHDARRFDMAVSVAIWLLVLIMFGPIGAGCFILAQMLTALTVETLGRRLLPVTALAAGACVFLPSTFSGSLVAETTAILAIGAPGLALGRIAGAADRRLYETMRCAAVAPQLLAIVGGAALGGLPGAAAATAAGWLASPVVALLIDRGARPGAAMAALGVVAAGLFAVLAMESLRPLTSAALVLPVGAVAGVAALRLHAPLFAHLLVRVTRRGMPTVRLPLPALAR